MSTTVAFPTSPEQLDPSSLSNLLGPRWLAGTSIDAVRAHPMGDGQGLLGQVCVLDVHYQGPTELPSSFVVKLPATNAASRSTARLGGLYLREFHFFTELAPGHDLSVPRCWAARFDEATHDFVLVLDRVDPLEPVDQLEGCPIERARATVSELARLHACWWDSPILPTLAWLPSFATAARIENLTNMARQGWPLLAELAADLLEPGDAPVGERLADDTPALLESLDARTPTLVHGDPRLDNLLFRPGEDSPVIVDWQGISRGPGMLDVGYFLTQSLTVADLRRHGPTLVEHYRAELEDRGIEVPPFAELWATFALAARFSLIVACSVAVLGPLDHPRVRALARSMAERSLRAIRDLDLELTTKELHP